MPRDQLPSGILAHFVTEDFEDGDRCARWGEFFSRRPGRFRVTPLGDKTFSGRVTAAKLGPITLFRIAATPHKMEKETGRAFEPDTLRLIMQVRGQAVLAQAGKEVLLEPGHWAAWSTDRAHSITNLTKVEQFALLIPMSHLGLRMGEVVQQAGMRGGDQPGVGCLLGDFVARLFDQLETIDVTLHSELADILTHLLRLCLTEARKAQAPVSMRETMRDRIADYVRHNLRDTDLNVARVAMHFGCTKRNVHKVFSSSGMTLSEFLWTERLERCRADLMKPELAELSITDIAFAWGFNSSSHFGKAFKARYGRPPGQVRPASNQMVDGKPATQ